MDNTLRPPSLLERDSCGERGCGPGEVEGDAGHTPSHPVSDARPGRVRCAESGREFLAVGERKGIPSSHTPSHPVSDARPGRVRCAESGREFLAVRSRRSSSSSSPALTPPPAGWTTCASIWLRADDFRDPSLKEPDKLNHETHAHTRQRPAAGSAGHASDGNGN